MEVLNNNLKCMTFGSDKVFYASQNEIIYVRQPPFEE